MKAKITEEKFYKMKKDDVVSIVISGFCMVVLAGVIRFSINKLDLWISGIVWYKAFNFLSFVIALFGGIKIGRGIMKGVKIMKLHKMPIICTKGIVVAKQGNLLCIEYMDKSLHNFISVCEREIEKGEKGIIFHKCGILYDFE